mmetsp:Transcript_11966/g.14878  ORF Transcript_11966/g.14878 Transcript_11966/m.14878 type:complete len:132 (+) Transcript_11966:559-954(+)
MHDFCLTLPYGVLLMLGGLIGAVKAGSLESGLTGGGIGAALCLLGKVSLDKYRAVKEQGSTAEKFPSMFILVSSLLLSGIVTYIMYDRYLVSGKVMPAGMVAGISGFMSFFYVFKIGTFSNLQPSVSAKAD